MNTALTTLRQPRLRPVERKHREQTPHIGWLVNRVARELGAAIRETGGSAWSLEIPTRSKRSQVVHVRHERESDLLELRSFVGPFRTNLGTTDLIRRNSDLVLGHIAVEDIIREGKVRPFISIRHSQPRTYQTADLRNALMMVGWAADELERTLFARDVE
jgi:hypothetical protein